MQLFNKAALKSSIFTGTIRMDELPVDVFPMYSYMHNALNHIKGGIKLKNIGQLENS